MQNPVENLEPGTLLVFAVKDQSTESVAVGNRAVAGGGGVRELGWGMLRVSKNTMNSQVSGEKGVGRGRGTLWGNGSAGELVSSL